MENRELRSLKNEGRAPKNGYLRIAEPVFIQ